MRIFISRSALLAALFLVTTGNATYGHTPKERQRDLANELAERFDSAWIEGIFNHEDMCAGRSIANPSLSTWRALEAAIMSDVSVVRGEMFFRSNESIFRDAASHYNNDPLLPFVMLAVLRIESDLGENRAGVPVVRVLFDKYHRVADGSRGNKARAKVLNEEIVPFMAMASQNEWDVCGVLGSRAAAFGYPHFVPGSLYLARDGDGDGKIDIMWNLADALYSMGNHFKSRGKGYAGGLRHVVFRYNPSNDYVRIVFRYALELQEKLE